MRTLFVLKLLYVDDYCIVFLSFVLIIRGLVFVNNTLSIQEIKGKHTI